MSYGDGVDWSTPLTDEDIEILENEPLDLTDKDKETIREMGGKIYKYFTTRQILTGALR